MGKTVEMLTFTHCMGEGRHTKSLLKERYDQSAVFKHTEGKLSGRKKKMTEKGGQRMAKERAFWVWTSNSSRAFTHTLLGLGLQ